MQDYEQRVRRIAEQVQPGAKVAAGFIITTAGRGVVPVLTEEVELNASDEALHELIADRIEFAEAVPQ